MSLGIILWDGHARAMPFEPGRQLGPYEIQAPLGAGGMGEVYQARDTRLDRLAIKISELKRKLRLEHDSARR